MAKKLDQGMVMNALDVCYDKAINGLPGCDSAEELAASYRQDAERSLIDSAESLVRYQIAKATTSGFLTGLGGILTLPLVIPVNIGSVIYIQLRMIAAIAAMGQHDVRSDQVKTMVYMCMCGSAMVNVVKGVGIQIGSKLSVSAINKISGATLTKINQAVGQRLLTKFGQTGAVNLGKMVPIVGGVIGGTVDLLTTKGIGKIAIKVFLAPN